MGHSFSTAVINALRAACFSIGEVCPRLISVLTHEAGARHLNPFHIVPELAFWLYSNFNCSNSVWDFEVLFLEDHGSN